MLVSLTVGKVDAGVAVLLTEDKRLIEFPSILLPPDISSGSIVDINVSRNTESEERAASQFAQLQDDIYATFGIHSPSAPILRCRNATQTSVVLEWDPVQLATAELRSLSLYRNGSKAGNIPRDKLSTKISGLAVDTEYTFHLVLRTSAGTYTSERLTVRTHKMTDLTGITITPGVMPQQIRDDLQATVDRIGAKLIDTLRIDTTHFVCTEGRGQTWEKAGDMNIPVVVPDWLKGCEREGRIVGVRAYYLTADPKLRSIGPGQSQSSPQPDRRPSGQPQMEHRQSGLPLHLQDQAGPLRVQPPLASPRIEHTPPTPEQTRLPEMPRSSAPAPIPEDRAVDGKPPVPPKDEAAPSKPPQRPGSADVFRTHKASNAVSDLPLRNSYGSGPPQELPSEPEPARTAEPAAVSSTAEEVQDDEVQQEDEKKEEIPTQPEEQPEVEDQKEEKTPQPEEVNNLRAIGIPHEDTPSSSKAPSEFDDVAL